MPRPYSLQRLYGFGLTSLPPDINNVPGGPGYEAFLRIEEMRAIGSLRSETSGVWSGRRHQLGSREERESFWVLEGNPWILDIREQYPLASPEVIAALLRGEQVARNRVMTIDFVATLAPRTTEAPLRYLALSSKSVAQREKPDVAARAERESRRVRALGWEWSYLDPPTALQIANHRRLTGWCTSRGLDECWEWTRDLATLFYGTTSKKPLRRLLPMLTRRLHIPERDQWFVFASAYYLGFLALDHRFPLDEDAPVMLAKRRHG